MEFVEGNAGLLLPESAKRAETFIRETYESPHRTPHISFTLGSEEERPSKNTSDFDPRLMRELFPPGKSGDSYMLGITAIHGNEPSIMTATIAAEINEILKEQGLEQAAIVLPSVYAKTKDILLEEFPAIADKVYLSDELGAILKQTEFSRAGYAAHMRSVAENQPRVQEELYEFLAKPFKAVSLAGEEREFQPQGRRLEINAGANVTASEPGKKETDFIFPVTLSDLIEATMSDPIVGRNFNKNRWRAIQKIAEDFEGRYRTTQIPYLNTLSAWPEFSTKGKILIPHIKRSRVPSDVYTRDEEGNFTVSSNIEPGKGIYVMGSGSDIGKEVVEDLAEQFHDADYDIIAPKWFNLKFGKGAIPDVIFHPQMQAVLGRYGWGIGWLSQEAGKPFLSMSHLPFDNPEMHFNIKTLEEFDLGREYKDDIDVIEELVKLQPGIHETNERIRRELNVPDGVDGIRYAAMNILRTALQSKQQLMDQAEASAGI